MTQRTNHRQIASTGQMPEAAFLRVEAARIALVLVLVLLITSGGAG
jgi:hypothetical protein